MLVSSLLEDAIVVGDGKKYITAVLTLNQEAGKKLVDIHDKVNLLHSEKIRSTIDTLVNDVNQKLSRVEQIKKYILAPNFSIETGELTHTQKVKKKFVIKKHENEISQMYK